MDTKNPPAADTPAAPAEAPKPVAPVFNGKTILIVEDEKPLSHALEMKFKGQGYGTKVVINGQEALAELGKAKYDIVLMDLIMPVMDGFGMLEEMQKRGLKIPVIVLSNLGQDEDRTKAKALGAVDYFVKSNTPIADIVARVKTVI